MGDNMTTYLDSMKKRARAFTEGVVIMVCPVLLAVSLKKVDMERNGNGSLRGIISPLAALNLEAGLLPFLCLCLSQILADGFAGVLFRASKLLLHLSALLLMVLAYIFLRFISMRTVYYILFLVPVVLLTLWRCYRSARNGGDHDAETLWRKLETSVDFSAAVTSLVFLGLEGLAFEGQMSSTGVQGPASEACSPGAPHPGDVRPLFGASIGMSFVTCVGGVFTMLLATVPPLIVGEDDSVNTCYPVEAVNILLAIAFAVTVFLITFAQLGELAWLVITPSLVWPMVWMYSVLGVDGDANQTPNEVVVTPASLELTKVTFTGFLAFSVTTFSDNNSNHAFTLLTAAAVITGLGWRLLTHMTPAPRPMVKAANVASFCAHLCVAASVVPFAIMASKALK